MSNFFRLADGAVRISVVAPVTARDGKVRLLVLRRDPTATSSRCCNRGHVRSRTRRDDAGHAQRQRRAVHQPLRHRPGAADVAAHPADERRRGCGAGGLQPGPKTFEDAVDYRGQPVVARSEPIPGTPWTLITKIDEAEILAEARIGA